jgi:hypothetical protein
MLVFYGCVLLVVSSGKDAVLVAEASVVEVAATGITGSLTVVDVTCVATCPLSGS